MKTLNNHLILYDAHCPMCDLYTGVFVKTGLLPADGRAPYQQTAFNTCPNVDRQRAVNEIALINRETGEVTYGIKSLFRIAGNACPVLGPVFRFEPVVWLFSKFYAFISYNRRVIIPAAASHSDNDLQPTFRMRYRIAYLLLTWFATGFILTNYTHLMIGIISKGNGLREYFICGGQIFFQGIVLLILYREKLWDYLGNMMTVSFAGALVLAIGMGIGHLTHFTPAVYLIFFLLTAGAMLFEHLRRCKLLGLSRAPSATWVFYRLIVLCLILTGLI